MDSGNHDDAYRNQELESKRVYDKRPQLKKIRSVVTNRTYRTYKTYSDLLTINRAYEDLVEEVSTGYPAFTQALVPPITLIKFVKPCFCSKLAAALER